MSSFMTDREASNQDELAPPSKSKNGLVYELPGPAVNRKENPEVMSRGIFFRADGLRPVPRELVEELRSATVTGYKRFLNQLIARVREMDDGSEQAVQELADKCEIDALAQLLEEACCR
jgi:hypothetical protein